MQQTYGQNASGGQYPQTNPKTFNKRRFLTGTVFGILLVIIVAILLSFSLSTDMELGVRIGLATVSLLVAAPLTCLFGFLLGLSGKIRRIGMGIVVGSLIGSALLGGIFFLV